MWPEEDVYDLDADIFEVEEDYDECAKIVRELRGARIGQEQETSGSAHPARRDRLIHGSTNRVDS